MRWRSLWFLLLFGAIWFGTWSWIIASHWSAQDVTSREYLLQNEFPKHWGVKHPECRKKFAFWPDGKRMNASDLKLSILDAMAPVNERTPDQVARDHWVGAIRAKIASCEEAQWLPMAKANAIANERINFLAGAFLPPIILLLAGLGIAWIWKRLAREHWLRIPQHLRRGFLRLYAAVSIPWVLWFGYQLAHAPPWRHISATWTLVSLPIGGPILLFVAIWVLAGFRTVEDNNNNRGENIS